MGLLTVCPRSAFIPSVPIPDCLEDFGQTQKVILQRLYKADGTPNQFVVATNSPLVLASWTPLLAAEDDTKVVQTPFLSNPANEPGAAREYGGGNQTIGGIPLTVGREPSPFTSMYLRTPQITIAALKKYQGEEIGVYLVNEYNQIMADSDGLATPLVYRPIPIHSLFVGDKKLGGLEEPDSNAFNFMFLPNWSDNTRILTPTNFKPLRDLVTPAD